MQSETLKGGGRSDGEGHTEGRIQGCNLREHFWADGKGERIGQNNDVRADRRSLGWEGFQEIQSNC